MQQVLEETLKNLCKRCPDSLAKKRQKLLALEASKLIDVIDNVPIDIKHLVDVINIICKLHKEKRETPGNILIQYVSENKSGVLNGLLDGIQNEDLNPDECLELVDLLEKKYQSINIFSRVDELVENLLEIKTLDSDLDVVKRFKETVTREYTNIVSDQEDVTEVELDASSGIVESIKQICILAQRKPVVSSGFDLLDEYLNGGFESSRVYMLGGKPGLGKSSLLLNFFCNMMQQELKNKVYDETKRKALVYITLENDIIESLERTIRILTGIKFRLRNASDEELETVSQHISNIARQKIFIKYMPPYITSTVDIFVYLSKISENYDIIGCLIDHVDLLTSSQKHQEKRHDLGIATMDLKTIATKFLCPIIVPSHLNTGGYDGIPTIKHLQESRQKAQNSDTVILMFQLDFSLIPPRLYAEFDPDREVFIGMNIDKNRDGPTGMLVAKFTKDLFKFEFLNKNESKSIISKLLSRRTYEQPQQNGQTQFPVDF